jgi:hypothetical protein
MNLVLMLFAGLIIPPGYADGLTYSMTTLARCQRMLAGLEVRNGPLPMCLLKVDPNAKPLPPMS